MPAALSYVPESRAMRERQMVTEEKSRQKQRWSQQGGGGGMHIHSLDPNRKPSGAKLDTRYIGPESLASRLSCSPLRAPQRLPWWSENHLACSTPSVLAHLSNSYTTFAHYTSFFSHWGLLFFLNVTILYALSGFLH